MRHQEHQFIRIFICALTLNKKNWTISLPYINLMSMKIKKWIHQIRAIHSVSSVKKKSSFKDGNYFETNTKLQHFFLHRNVNLQNNRYLLIDGGVIRHLYDIFLLLFFFPSILRQLKWHSSGEKNGATWFSVFFYKFIWT